MGLLVFYLCLALGVSFLCSILEAVILSVTPSYIEALNQRTPRAGKRLHILKENIDRPLAAILSLNTIAHTVGAVGVGAQALVVFGSGYVAITSAVLTILILVFSEIIPKTLGAFYWRRLAVITSRLLPLLITLMYPLVKLSEVISVWLQPSRSKSIVNREELLAMSELARKEGIFGEKESHILKSLLHAGRLTAEDVMTPRTVIFSLPAEESVGDVLREHAELRFSRIPIYANEPENIQAYVLKSDIMNAASGNRDSTRLSSLAREIQVVPEITSLLVLFEKFLNCREHIALVVDEYGGTVGIVTLEDIVETLLGIEIVDESDESVDMQAKARRLGRRFY